MADRPDAPEQPHKVIQPLHRATFRACTVEVLPDHVRTTFVSDGSISLAYWDFQDDGSHLEATHYVGLGTDRRAMVIQHEFAHAVVAERLGQPHSYSVWSHAHGTGQPGRPFSQRVADEEHLCVRLQRYANTGAADEYGRLEAAFGNHLRSVAYELEWLCRPCLGRLVDRRAA